MKIKNGDRVMVSERNPNHLGHGITAYAGWQGKVTELQDNGGFTLDCGDRSLVISKSKKLLLEDINGSWVLIDHKIK